MIKYLLTGIAFLGHWFSFSQNNVLNLEQCMRMADTANRTILNAQFDIASNAEQNKAYQAAKLPKLTFTGDYRYNAKIPGQVVPAAFFGGAPGTYGTVQFGVPYVFSNTLQLTQIIYNPQVNYGLSILEINGKILASQKELTTQDIRYQVASTYFAIQGVQKQLEFVDTNLQRMNILLKNMEAMVKQGMIIQTESDKLKINQLTLSNTKTTLRSTEEQLLGYLKLLCGIEKEASIQLETDQMVQQSMLVNKSEPSFYALDIIQSQQQLNKEEHIGTNMAYLPSLSFYSAYNYNVNMKPEDNFRKGIDGAFIGLRLDWTLFDGLEKHFKQKQNAINREKLANQYDLTQAQLTLAVENNERQIPVRTNALEIAKEQLKLAENIAKNATLKFGQGMISSNDLVLAQNGLSEAQTNLVRAYIDLRQAELELLKSIGNIK